MNIRRNSIVIPSRTHFFLIGFCIIALAIVLRIIWAILISTVPVSDGRAYNILAHTLVDHHVYGWSAAEPSAFWPPGTSIVYAALYFLFGYRFLPIVIFNIICSTLIVGLTILLGRIFFDRVTAITAGVLMAIWPSEIAYVTILASELPFTLLVLLGMTVWFSERWTKSARAIASGLLFGAATYFRSVALLLPIALLFTEISDWQKFRNRLSTAALAMIIAFAIIAPWSIRNFGIFGHTQLLTTSDGVNLWMGNNPEATGFYMTPPADTDGMNEYDQNHLLGERAKQYIMTNPASFILRTIEKAGLLHAGETIAVYWNTDGIRQRFGEAALFPLKIIMEVFWLLVLLLALAAIIIMAYQHGIIRAFTHPAVLVWLYFTMVYAAILVADRFHFPSHPLIAMLAAMTNVAIITRISGNRVSSRQSLVGNLASTSWQPGDKAM